MEVASPGELSHIDGLVIPGGESTTIYMLAESSGLFEPMTQMIKEGMPVFGTCAGAVLLARRILDGRADQRSCEAMDIAVRRNGFGRQIASFEADLDISVIDKGGAPLRAVFIRAPIVESVGPEVETLATYKDSALTEPTPVLLKQGTMLASSFHPELSNDTRLHQFFVEMVKEGSS
jgi:5'-phosphate synthase pdxT subunit